MSQSTTSKASSAASSRGSETSREAKVARGPSHHGRLSTMDASFLYFERESAPMHIGALAIIDGEIDSESYLEQVENRLRRLPRFRERIVPPPLYVGHPTWETDPDFDLRRHMPVHVLATGTEAELRELTNRLIEGAMPRTRPLWEIHLIKGLEGGRSALVSKVHHAMVDGVGGNAIMLALFDLEPNPPAKDLEDRYIESHQPTGLRRMGEALWDNVRNQIDVWSSHMTRLTDIGQATGMNSLQRTVAILTETMPDLLMPPKRLPFNRRCSGERAFTFTEIPFADARAIRSAIGGTVNDVMLAALGGALAKYARHHGEETDGRTARVMVPVNVRPEGASANLGNLVSILPVRVPLDIDDPALRLHAVRAGTRVLKDGGIAEGVSLMTNLASAVPAPFQAAFGAIAISPYPIFNLVCTNVPGPQIPLYAQGFKLSAYYPIVPVGFDMGVCCAIFSYDQKMFIGLNSDVGACDDIEDLKEFFDQSFEELRAAAAALAGEASERIEIRRVPIRGRSAEPESAKVTKNSTGDESGSKAAKKAKEKSTQKKSVAKKSVAKKKVTKEKAATKKAATKKKATTKKKKSSVGKASSKKASSKKATKKATKRTAAKKKTAKKKTAKSSSKSPKKGKAT